MHTSRGQENNVERSLCAENYHETVSFIPYAFTYKFQPLRYSSDTFRRYHFKFRVVIV